MIASLAALVLVTAADRDPRALADLHLAWRGGTRLESLSSIHARGSMKAMGLDGTIERWSTAGGFEREDRDLTVLKVSEGNGPDGGWSRGPAGQVDRMSPSARLALVEDAGIDFGRALRKAPGVKLADGGDEIRAGRTWRVLRVTYLSGSVYDLLIDGMSGELEGERVSRNGRSVFVDLSDWRMIEGVRVAFREDASGTAPGQARHFAYSTVELNAETPRELLARPAPRKIATFEAGRRSTGPLPIEIFDGRRIFVDAEVGGRMVSAMIDSGAASSVLDTAFAGRTGVRSSGAGSAIGAAGTAAVAIGSAGDVKLGSLTLQALPFAVMDLTGVSMQLGRPLQMVIGRDLFDQLVVTLDARNRTITLSDPGGFAPEKRAIAVPLTAEGPLRILDVALDGVSRARLHFDLGNGTPLVLYPGFRPSAGIRQGRLISQTLVGGVGGSVVADTVAVRSLGFGGVVFHDVPAILMPTTGGAGDTDLVDGNLGFPILSRFRMSIDYSHDRMWLTPSADAAATPFERDRSGLGLQAGPEGLTVKLVASRSPGSATTLHVGDVIVRIDGSLVGPNYASSGLSKWRFGPVGRIVTLTLKDGSTKTLTLRDFI